MRIEPKRIRRCSAAAGFLLCATVSTQVADAQRSDTGPLYEARHVQTIIELTGRSEITADSLAFRTKLQVALRHEGIHVDEEGGSKVPPTLAKYTCTMATMEDARSAMYECALVVYRFVALGDLPSTIRAKRWPAFPALVWSSRDVLPRFVDTGELRHALLDDLAERTDQLRNDWLVANRP